MELAVRGWGRDHGERVLVRRDLTEARPGDLDSYYSRPDIYITSVPEIRSGPLGRQVDREGSTELRFYAKITLGGEFLVRQTLSRQDIARLFLSQYGDCSIDELLDVLGEINAKKWKFRRRPFPSVMLKRIEDLGLSEGTASWLSENFIWYVGDLVQKFESQMEDLPNFNQQRLREIKDLLTALGLQFGMEVQGWPKVSKMLLKKVDDLELSVRSSNCLHNDGVKYLGDLVQKTEAELLRSEHFGRKSLNEIKEVLAQMGLRLGMKINDWPPEGIENFQTEE